MRRILLACSSALALAAAAAWALAQQPAPAAKPPVAGAPAAAAPAHGVTHGVVKAPAKMAEKPLWRDLNAAQRTALAPLATEWDQMDGVRKQKWLEMSNHFASLKPDDQARIHERMREWVRLTPAERKLARDTYKRTRKLAPGEKTATWESYQQLPDDQKQKLAEAAAARKPAATTTHTAAPLRSGASGCPAGKIKNKVSATPPCVPAPAPAATVAPAAQAPAASAQPSPTSPPASAPAVPASNGQ